MSTQYEQNQNCNTFADDTIIHFVGSNVKDISSNLQGALDTIMPWYMSTRLSINANKSAIMLIGKPSKVHDDVYHPKKVWGQFWWPVLRPLSRASTSEVSFVWKGISRIVDFDNWQWVWKELIFHIHLLKNLLWYNTLLTKIVFFNFTCNFFKI